MKRHILASAALVLLLLAGVPGGLFASAGDTLFPDLIVPSAHLYDNEIVGNVQPGRVHIRLSVGVANVGSGPVYVYGVRPDNGDGTQDVNQVITVRFAPPIDRHAGTFLFHAEHGHIHFADWTQYRIREKIGDSAGAVVAQGMKTSFCIIDESIYTSQLPNFDPNGGFFSCGVAPNQEVIQGLSVGWQDVYDKSLPDQYIDITGVPSGTYWLEVEADPEQRIMESNEENNITRIPLTLSEVNVDQYEPNDAIYMLDDRQTGAPRSPNLGPCDPQLVIDSLNLHLRGDRDYFSFYSNELGGPGDFVRIDWTTGGTLVLQLLDESFSIQESKSGTSEVEIELSNRFEGLYYIKVLSVNGNAHSGYRLTINPPSNRPPVVLPQEPATADTVNWSTDTYTVRWDYSDPESDSCWVTILANTAPVLDGNEIELPGTLLTPASQRFAIVNSAYLEPATYYFCYRITDAGTTTHAWSSGTVTFRSPSCCEISGNIDCSSDGRVDIADLTLLADHIFVNQPPLCCPEAAELTGNEVVDVEDLLRFADFLFLGGQSLSPCN